MKKIVPIIFYVILSCLVPVVFCTASYAQIETPLRIPITPEEIQIGKVDWYGVYIQGEKIGYSTISISYDSDDLCYLVKQKYHMKLKSLNQKLDTITETLLKFKDKPPYAFLHAISTTSINSINKSSVEVAKSDDGFKVIVSSGGEKQIKNIPIIDYTLEDLLTPEQWIKQSPNIGDKISTRLFDNSFLKPYI
ncbi:MAG: hypothetical protein GY777_25845, partial [Candidatus Brocadiaceae bacterium]|nr:hypothetical protein [Candidatus Brocadiaceae bacterium]